MTLVPKDLLKIFYLISSQLLIFNPTLHGVWQNCHTLHLWSIITQDDAFTHPIEPYIWSDDNPSQLRPNFFFTILIVFEWNMDIWMISCYVFFQVVQVKWHKNFASIRMLWSTVSCFVWSAWFIKFCTKILNPIQ